MKKLLFLSITFCMYIHASSQELGVFPTDSAEWNVVNITGETPVYYYNCYRYKYDGDTLINNIKYSRISNFEDSFYIRIDSFRVYNRYTIGDTLEKVLYDFNLKLNDTGYIYIRNKNLYFDTIQIKVTSVDSVLTTIGLKKRLFINTYFFGACNRYNYWIEGIGCIIDPFYSQYPWRTCYVNMVHLHSFYYKGKLIYGDNRDCESLSARSNKYNDIISIWPNPVTKHLKISCTENICNDCKISICNLQGIKLMQFKPDNKEKIEIDVSALPSGMYVLEIISENSKVMKKFIKY